MDTEIQINASMKKAQRRSAQLSLAVYVARDSPVLRDSLAARSIRTRCDCRLISDSGSLGGGTLAPKAVGIPHRRT